jgi:hypothetical protein
MARNSAAVSLYGAGDDEEEEEEEEGGGGFVPVLPACSFLMAVFRRDCS